MSTSISGRGKTRKHGDLNTNATQMGGGQMAMPPGANGAAPVPPFATPTVPINQGPHYQEYAPPRNSYGVDFIPTPLVSGASSQNPQMAVPNGMSIQQEQASHFANMQGMPANMRNAGNQNMQQWQQQQPMAQHQQHMMPAGVQQHMARGMPAQQPRYQPQQQPMGGYYPAAPQGYFMPGMTPEMYQHQQQQYYAQLMQQQQQQQQQPYYPNQMMQQQPVMQQQAPPAMQQGGGGPGAGAPMGTAPQHSQQAPVHGGSPQTAGAQPMHSAAAPGAPVPAPLPNFTPAMQQQQQRPPVEAAPRKKNVLAIVDPTTQKTVNAEEIEASKREEDAPKAEKEEAKGTDEVDAAAPEVKKQFAEQIRNLEQTTKSDQSAPAPTPAPAAKPLANKCLFNLEQINKLGLADKVTHTPAPSAPVVAAPVAAAAPAAPAAEKPVTETPKETPKQKQPKQSTPEVTPAEMPSTTVDEQADESVLAEAPVQHDEPASSSSEKNTSNDSAICVQTPPPVPKETEKAVVLEEEEPAATAVDEQPVEEEEEQKEVEQPAAAVPAPVPVEEPLVKKLEQLVIAESASQEEAESEPSTPAPVTPSVSETAATLAEEEEDAEKAAAAAEEARQQKRAELEAEIALNLQDPDQVDESQCRYNREYLYNVRDLEKMFHVTECPLSPDQLKGFGICRSLVSNEPKRKQDGQGGFMPGWARSQGGGGGGRGGGPKPYQGRQSEQHQRGGGGKHGQNRKLPPNIRPSIERRVETNVQLHKAEQAWKPEKVAETDESEETKKKLLLKTIRALFNKITPTNKDALMHEFLDHKVYESPALNDVISIIFDKAVEEPKFCPLYSNMCNTQVGEELKLNKNVSLFRNAILVRAQETFTTKNLDDYVATKQAEIDEETDEKKKREKQIELLEAQSKFRRRKFGNITFIGQLYLQGLISVRIIHFCVFDLLKSVVVKEGAVAGEPDEDAVDCAVRLLETIGKRLQGEANAVLAANAAAKQQSATAPKQIQRHGGAAPAAPAQPQQQAPFPIDLTFQTLEGAIPVVSSRIKFMIMNLTELRRNGWVPRKSADAGPKKLDEIKKDIQKEQMENAQQQQQYERKQSRQEPMGGRGMGGGGGGGGHGGHGNNPKRQIIQRNSRDDRSTIEERRSQAFKAANLQPARAGGAPAKKASLSSITANEKSLGGKSNKWATGASGGSENSKKEDRAAAIQQASRMMGGNQRSSSAASMKEDEGASASGNATQVNSEDEREQNEKREKEEAEITKRVVRDVGDYGTGEINLDEVREELFKILAEEKFGKPTLQTLFKCYIAAAIKKVTSTPDLGPKFGHVLAYCLLKKTEEKDKKGGEEILRGVAESARDIVEQEQWEDAPRIWDIFAEVLINTHIPEDGVSPVFVGAHPTLVDFKDTFLNAAKDTRKPYTLFVLVLKRLSEIHHKRDKDQFMEMASWVLPECELITKNMDKEKLDRALKDTKTSFDQDLHSIMRQEH